MNYEERVATAVAQLASLEEQAPLSHTQTPLSKDQGSTSKDLAPYLDGHTTFSEGQAKHAPSLDLSLEDQIQQITKHLIDLTLTH